MMMMQEIKFLKAVKQCFRQKIKYKRTKIDSVEFVYFSHGFLEGSCIISPALLIPKRTNRKKMQKRHKTHHKE